jgi:hypothetical protein
MAKSRHHGSATKSVRASMLGGGNLKLPNPKQAIHVAPQKDTLSHNVGGNEHMGPAGEMGHEDYIASGGKGKPHKTHEER